MSEPTYEAVEADPVQGTWIVTRYDPDSRITKEALVSGVQDRRDAIRKAIETGSWA